MFQPTDYEKFNVSYNKTMAHNNIEVEIKIKLTKSKFEKTKLRLEKIAKRIKTSHHNDAYYNPIYEVPGYCQGFFSPLLHRERNPSEAKINLAKGDKSFLKQKYPYEWLTIRQRDGKVKLNFKHWYPEGVKNTTHCDEYETEVSDKTQIEKILKALHFENFITIDKKRITYIYKNELEIALDEVKGLGYFIEVESIKNEGGVNIAHQKLIDFLQKELGITKTTTVPGGYAAEMMRKLKLAAD